jgi:hypothetical protein
LPSEADVAVVYAMPVSVDACEAVSSEHTSTFDDALLVDVVSNVLRFKPRAPVEPAGGDVDLLPAELLLQPVMLIATRLAPAASIANRIRVELIMVHIRSWACLDVYVTTDPLRGQPSTARCELPVGPSI